MRNAVVVKKKNAAATAVEHYNMNLQQLIPTLKLACSCALARHTTDDIHTDAYLALGLDANDTASVIFVNNPHAPVVPPQINSAVIFFSKGLIPLLVVVAGMDLAHEVAVEKMTKILLSKIPVWIFEIEPKDSRFLELGNQLSDYAVAGITSAINAQDQSAVKLARLKDCEHPERN